MLPSKPVVRRALQRLLDGLPAKTCEIEEVEALAALRRWKLYQEAKTVGIFLSMTGEFNTRSIIDDCFASKKRVFVPVCPPRTLGKVPPFSPFHRHPLIFVEVTSAAELDTEFLPANSPYGIPEPKWDTVGSRSQWTYYGAHAHDTTSLLSACRSPPIPADHPVFSDAASPVASITAQRTPTSHTALPSIPCLDLLLVPGLGFSLDGPRLGRGAGYYDSVLQVARLAHADAAGNVAARDGASAGARPLCGYVVGVAYTPQVVTAEGTLHYAKEVKDKVTDAAGDATEQPLLIPNVPHDQGVEFILAGGRVLPTKLAPAGVAGAP